MEDYETLPTTKKPTAHKKKIIKEEITEKEKRPRQKIISEKPEEVEEEE